VLLSGVQGITDLITTPGLINLDFADVKSVMSGAGSALMGIGSSRGDDRAVAAAEMAISSPLLEASIDGAHGVLLSIQGGSDLGLFEINEAAQLVANSAAPDANIIFGAVIDDALGDEVRVTVIAAGFDEARNGRVTSVRTISAYQPTQGSDAFGAPWRPVTLPTLKESAADAGSPVGPLSPGATSAGSGTTAASHVGGAPPEVAASTTAPAAHPVTESIPTPRSAERLTPGDDHEAPSGEDGASHTGHTGHTGRADGPSTRRRSVVFEEDDELDVPDFLK
jgi:cell division protein FtsZ